ncbi:MAG: PAS domain S-box protein [Dehalococcoidia bacterium]
MKTRNQLLAEREGLRQRVARLEEELRQRAKVPERLREEQCNSIPMIESSEDAHLGNDELFRGLMEHAADAFVIHDMEGTIIDVSQMTGELLGFTREQLIGLPVWEIVETMPVGGAKEWQEMVPGVSLTDWSIWRRQDGSTFPVEVHLRTFEWGGQQVIFALGRDITERQEAEKSLRESEERFRVLMEHSADAFFIHDLEGNIVDVNHMACESLGYTREELLSLGIPDIYPLCPKGGAAEWRTMVPGVPVTLVAFHQRKDGTTFPTEVSIRTFDLHGERFVLGVARDITERHEAEKSLRESEERFRILMEHSAAAFFIHDLQGRIVDVNQMACDSLGYTREELLSLRVADIYPLCPREGASEWRTMVPGVPLTVIVFHQRKDETTFPAEVSINAFDLHGQRFVLGVARDITERQAAEETQRELAVLEERNRLARELHDSVTQALYSASLMSEAGQRFADSGDSERVRHYLGRLGDTCQQALKEMRLLVYQLRPSVLEQEGIVGALRQRLDAVEQRAGVEARLIFADSLELPPKWEEELYRISQEALNNSLKYSAATSVTVRITAQNGGVNLEIEDNGVGFDPDAVADKGGLGLTSMRERVESIPGTLTIDSATGQGTRVRVSVASWGSD